MLDNLIVSSSGERIACVAYGEDKQFVVVDGKEGKQYESIGEGTLIFSPDSKHLAYMARESTKTYPFVVVDGNEGNEYEGIGGWSLKFSPDSKHVAYAVKRGNQAVCGH